MITKISNIAIIIYVHVVRSYNVRTRDLPDIYAQSRVRAADLRAWAHVSGKSQVPVHSDI